MFVVYVLLSEDGNRTYVGQTRDFEERLTTHNAGRVRSTKAFRPWKVIHREEYRSRSESMAREKWFKSRTGRQFIAEIIDKSK